MARYRKVDPRIWNDAKFCALSDDGKLTFFMVMTHPGMTSLGAMRATSEGLAAEAKWPAERFAEAFHEALSKGLIEYDGKASLVALPNFTKYNRPESPNVIKAWAGCIDLLPECDLRNRVVARAEASLVGLDKSFHKAFAQAFAKALPKDYGLSGAGAVAGTVAVAGNKKSFQSHSESHTENLNKKQPLKTIVQQAARFEEFWAGYPVKKGKAKAMKSWKSKGCDAIADQIIEHVQHMQAHDDDWARGYIPHGSTYVNGELWNDEPRRKPEAGAQQPSKTMQGIQALEDAKNERRQRRLDQRRIDDGIAKAALSSPGPDAGG